MIFSNMVSEGAILRDWGSVEYLNEEHKRLVDIADTLYNANIPVENWNDNPEYNYKALYKRYGKEYFDRVIKDMVALDSQVDSTSKAQELAEEYEYLLETNKEK